MTKLLFIFLLITTVLPTAAYDKDKLSKKWQNTPYDLYLSAQEAYDMKTSNHENVLLLDVRNEAEIHYTGMPDTVDANIPYRFDSNKWKMKKKGNFGTFKMPKNPNFIPAIKNLLTTKNMSTDNPVIIMCATGSRAPFAVKALHKAGFKEVYSQVEGFEGVKAKTGKDKGRRVVSGWKVSKLPWSYDLIPEKMYFNFAPEAVKHSLSPPKKD